VDSDKDMQQMMKSEYTRNIHVQASRNYVTTSRIKELDSRMTSNR